MKNLCFDLDGTLLDYRIGELTARLLLRQKIAETADYPEDMVARHYDLYWAQIKRHYWEMIDDGLTEQDIRAIHLNMVIEEAWSEADPKQLAQLHLDTALDHMQVYPDATKVIQQLSKKYTLTMITNGPRDLQRHKINRLDFTDHLQEIIISGELGHHKPSPQIFNENTKRTGIPPEETVYIGNDYQKDIRGAHNAGWKTVWVNRNNEKPEEIDPDWTIKELSELLTIF